MYDVAESKGNWLTLLIEKNGRWMFFSIVIRYKKKKKNKRKRRKKKSDAFTFGNSVSLRPGSLLEQDLYRLR